MTVSRETVALGRRFGLSAGQQEGLDRLLEALAAQPDPPTTVREPSEARDVHVADSLVGLEVDELARASSIADLGAGAGFPGLVLALALPGARVDLIESTARKCVVIEELAEAAEIGNARALAVRAEDRGREARGAYAAVTARALAALPVLVEYAAPLLVEDGVFVAWKAKRDVEEERAATEAASVVGLELDRVLKVSPFPAATDRHLHVFRKIGPTPDRFPRRPGMARKRPLA